MPKATQPRTPRAITAEIFVQDPKVRKTSKGKIGLTTIEVAGEPWLGSGPMSSRFKVVDNAPLARPRASYTGFSLGRSKSPEANFKFHQVNAWAIMARLLALLESPRVFGRRIPWGFDGGRLEIRPHDEEQSLDNLNAWYDSDSAAIRFGYTSGKDGHRVYTCLSHDIIAHEFGHAVLHGLKPYYDKSSATDQDAFHEFFGDALAMFSLLTMDSLLTNVLTQGGKKRATGRKGKKGDLREKLGWITDLMEEFGGAIGEDTGYIRSARNKLTMFDLEKNTTWGDLKYPLRFETYEGAKVLTGAARDVFLAFYAERSKAGESPVDAVLHAAAYTSRMMLRAVDYCPPVGFRYGTYVRAILRADEVAYPRDERGYRDIVQRVFEDRGLTAFDDRSIDAEDNRVFRNADLQPYDIDAIGANETNAYIFVDENRDVLGIPRDADFRMRQVYSTRKKASGGYYVPREVVLEFLWKEDISTKSEPILRRKGKTTEMWCGGTLVFDVNGNVLHYTLSGSGPKRRKTLLEYLAHQAKLEQQDAESEAAERKARSGTDRRKQDRRVADVGKGARLAVDRSGRLEFTRNRKARCSSQRSKKVKKAIRRTK